MYVVLAVAVSALLGFWASSMQPSTDVLIVVVIATACLAPIIARVALGKFDILEPIVAINFALIAMYVTRPIGMLVKGPPHVFKGDDISGELTRTLLVALLAVISCQVGYHTSLARMILASAPRLRPSWDLRRTLKFSLILAGSNVGKVEK